MAKWHFKTFQKPWPLQAEAAQHWKDVEKLAADHGIETIVGN